MKLKISPFMIVVGVVMAFSGRIQLFLCYLAALVFHEYAHAAVAQRLGYALSEMKIMPYGASLSGKFESMTPRDEIKVALAGPLVNMLFAVVFTAIWRVLPASYFFTAEFVEANLFLAIFNMLPVYPLDGGRIVLSLLGYKKWAQIVMNILAVAISVAFALIFVFGDKSDYTLLTAAFIIMMSTLVPDKKRKYRKLYDMAYRTDKLLRVLPVKLFAVVGRTPLYRVKKKISGNCFSVFYEVEKKRYFTESDLDKIGSDKDRATVSELEELKPRDNILKINTSK